MDNNNSKELINRTVIASIEQFYQAERRQLLSFGDFLFYQFRLLNKWWLFWQTVLMVALYIFLRFEPEMVYYNGAFGLTACLLVIFLIPNMWRERNANSSELISTCYYSLEHIYTARLIIMGIYDLLLLSIFFVLTKFTTKLTIYTVIIHFVLPLLVIACVCFSMLSFSKTTNSLPTIFICVFISALLFMLTSVPKIYDKISNLVWYIVLFASVVLLAYSLYRLVHPINRGNYDC